MRPLAQSDGHDSPGLIEELVPRHTAVVDEIIVRFEDAVRQPVVTQELPDVALFSWARCGLMRIKKIKNWHLQRDRRVAGTTVAQAIMSLCVAGIAPTTPSTGFEARTV